MGDLDKDYGNGYHGQDLLTPDEQKWYDGLRARGYLALGAEINELKMHLEEHLKVAVDLSEEKRKLFDALRDVTKGLKLMQHGFGSAITKEFMAEIQGDIDRADIILHSKAGDKMKNDGYWWCDGCGEELPPSAVTALEKCMHCGWGVKWYDPIGKLEEVLAVPTGTDPVILRTTIKNLHSVITEQRKLLRTVKDSVAQIEFLARERNLPAPRACILIAEEAKKTFTKLEESIDA